jgi:hypothetical protein
MDRYHRAVRVPVEAHGGTVVQLLGDGVMCAFGVPRVAEDDAIRAVRAAVAIVEAVGGLGVTLLGDGPFSRTPRSVTPDTLSVRVAVNTGEVVVSDEYAAGIGDPLNVAARLQQEAHAGEVLISESTQRLVRDHMMLAPVGVFSLKGRSEKVAAYRVVSLERPASAAAIPFVGRDEELRRLAAVYEAAVSEPRARLGVILGSPGLGKSRLLGEFARRLGDRATVLTARCDAAGGATFAPVVEALRAFLRLDDTAGAETVRAAVGAVAPGEPERARIAAGIAAFLVGAPASPEETFFVVRRLLAALAAVRPVVLAIDDLQWAEPLLLDLAEHLVQWSTAVPLLVLAAARPELRDVRSSLAGRGGLVAEALTLTGLDAGAATRLAANVIGAAELPAAVAGRVLAASEGNPLFVGELVRMLVHDGALKREGDRWTAGAALADLQMPPTIQALLAARIERLRPEERTVLERAAVVGRHFSRSAVAHLLPSETADLDGRLEALRRSELVEPDTGWFLGEPALRFHHLLIRDAAYRRLLKGTRAELHGRLADWIESRVGESVEHDETIGWHLEQAHRHLHELGPLDERGRALGERAARYLAAAGRRALARDDLHLAASLFGRALARLDGADPSRPDVVLDWCEALLAAGDVAQAKTAIDELATWSRRALTRQPPPEQSGPGAGRLEPPVHDARPLMSHTRLSAWHTCFAGELAVLTDPRALRTTARAVAAAADELAAVGDAAGEAKAHSVHALALARLGAIGACEAALDRALAAARRAQDRRRANAVLAGAPLAALWGPSPVTRASGRCLDVVRLLRMTQGAPAVEAVALRCQAVLEALRGRIDAARQMIASARRMVEELGITQRLLEADVFAGHIELLEGDAVAAERSLRAAYDGMRAHGLGIDAARAAALLGRALLAQERAAEAEALTHESAALAGDDINAAIAWRGVRAEALARRGEHAAAVQLARAAVDIAAKTDALLDHAGARLALAAALRAAGRTDGAEAEEARAIVLWEAKGATVLAERARAARRVDAPLARLGNEQPKAGSSPTQTPRRRVRPNFATEHSRALTAAMTTGNTDVLATLIRDDVDVVHHPTGMVFGRDESLGRLRAALEVGGLTFSHEPLASLGDSLALCSATVSAAEIVEGARSLGAVETDLIVVSEADVAGRASRVETFARDRLGDAIVRLYARYAELLPEGPARDRAAGAARTLAVVVGAVDPSAWVSVLSPAVEFIDTRTAGMGAIEGPEAVVRGMRAFLELTEDLGLRVDDVLGLRADALVVRATHFGVARSSGGAFERILCGLFRFADDGTLARLEEFDAGREAEALARFDELAARPTPGVSIENAATRTVQRAGTAWTACDWDRFAALCGPRFRHHDARALGRLDLDRDQFLASVRPFFEAARAAPTIDVLATRGDRLTLLRATVRVDRRGSSEPVGPSEVEVVAVIEVDGVGDCAAVVAFGPADLDAASAELEQRYAAEATSDRRGALTRTFTRAFDARDWDALATLLAPDLVVADHRLLGWETLRGPAAYIQALKSLVDLAPDVRLRVDHLTMSDPRFLYLTTWVGTRDGGAFETPSAIVCELDATDRIRRFDQYDLGQLEEAQARLAASRSASSHPTG